MAIRKLTTKMPKTATLKQILKKCSSTRRKSSSWLGVGDEEWLPEDVPRGHFAVYIGETRSRHIVLISWLGHPQFQCLLQRAEEYGFGHGIGIASTVKRPHSVPS